MNNTVRKTVTAGLVALAVAACATDPKPVTEDERRVKAAELNELFEAQEPLAGPLTLSEAMARAIKYNVDHRVKLMEHVLAKTDLDVSRFDLLPQIVLDAGYTSRSNDYAFSSESVITGQESLEPSRSSERQQTLANAALVWNLLDLGVSYVSAQQKADQVLIAEERRRKAVQNIIQDVRAAYWQALYAQRLGPELDGLLADIESAVETSRQLQADGLQSAATAARYQESLLTSLRQLWRLRDDMEVARAELARLINVSPGTRVELEPAPAEIVAPEVNQTPLDVEQQALTDRPELREEDYQLSVDHNEVKKVMLRMLPGLEIELGARYDSNDFLVNNNWSDVGLRISWNLFNLFSGPAFKREAEARVDLDNIRRLAKSMAILTQVHVAFEGHRAAKINYDIASQLAGVNQRILEQIQAQQQAEAGGDLARIRARARLLVAQLQRDRAFAELQNAVGRIQNSIGMDPLPEHVAAHDLRTLSHAFAEHQSRLDAALAVPSRQNEPQPAMVERPTAAHPLEEDGAQTPASQSDEPIPLAPTAGEAALPPPPPRAEHALLRMPPPVPGSTWRYPQLDFAHESSAPQVLPGSP